MKTPTRQGHLLRKGIVQCESLRAYGVDFDNISGGKRTQKAWLMRST
jgi:hypothetical protein